jgi:hypothetical protein
MNSQTTTLYTREVTKFRNKKLPSYFAKLSYYFANFHEISQTNIAKFREKIAQHLAEHCQFVSLDPGHAQLSILDKITLQHIRVIIQWIIHMRSFIYVYNGKLQLMMHEMIDI